MKLSIISLLASFSLAFAAALPAPPVPTAAVPNDSKIVGNFSHSCAQITLMNKYFLAASCNGIHPAAPDPKEGNGTHVPSPGFNQLDLNQCIGFDQGTGGPESGGGVWGKLIWQPIGKFSNYCTDCSLTGPRLKELKCNCVPMTGPGATTTVIDLDEGVENRNGTLVCRGGMGSGIGPGPLPPIDD
ncbi:hypothetical protein QBC32DRAFT_233150 [Pseudoneurospora amorphoporcata]|uniref:Cyanovirin-N domain-containing protein n=1 Tax=Pseudoneurospora amorphoporcata TaxID=241081 RepID=A0AAN6NY42_9PEZI|nr:hypothetical protein QBC32DRAFT_233150 [Pseudoneurospora amorphoporcata]